MQYQVMHVDPRTEKTDCLMVGVFADKKLSDAAALLDQQSDGFISRVLKQGDFEGEVGQTFLLSQVPSVLTPRVLLVGCGLKEALNESTFRRLMAKSAATLKTLSVTGVVSYLTDLTLVSDRDIHWKVRQAVQMTDDVLYGFNLFKTQKNNRKKELNQVVFNVSSHQALKSAEEALAQAQAICAGMTLTKNLGNSPANICTPTYMAEQAKQLARQHKTIKVTVLERKDMEKLGMGALLSVARGSHQPPKLVVMKYQGTRKNKKPIVLVGKGVTFDSGGISLKPAAGMEEMKFDMCGAASVMGTLKAIAELELPINVIGVAPITENLPGGNASKPGDIVTTMSGQTVEIMNTDAEGRLILSDALSYCEQFNPEAVIDIATLTGAVVVALGAYPSGLMGNDENLMKQLKRAGEVSGDRVWQLPLWDEYQEQIDSNLADMANVGLGGGKSITAACFLSRFTKKYQWAHLDIAGTAWQSGKDKLASGRPVPLLVQYLLDHCHALRN